MSPLTHLSGPDSPLVAITSGRPHTYLLGYLRGHSRSAHLAALYDPVVVSPEFDHERGTTMRPRTARVFGADGPLVLDSTSPQFLLWGAAAPRLQHLYDNAWGPDHRDRGGPSEVGGDDLLFRPDGAPVDDRLVLVLHLWDEGHWLMGRPRCPPGTRDPLLAMSELVSVTVVERAGKKALVADFYPGYGEGPVLVHRAAFMGMSRPSESWLKVYRETWQRESAPDLPLDGV